MSEDNKMDINRKLYKIGRNLQEIANEFAEFEPKDRADDYICVRRMGNATNFFVPNTKYFIAQITWDPHKNEDGIFETTAVAKKSIHTDLNSKPKWEDPFFKKSKKRSKEDDFFTTQIIWENNEWRMKTFNGKQDAHTFRNRYKWNPPRKLRTKCK